MVLGVVLATVVYGDFNLSPLGVGPVIDPPGLKEAAALAAIFSAFPSLVTWLGPFDAPFLVNPYLLAWAGLRGAVALVSCLLVARWSRWQFRHRSDPDALLGTFLVLLPVGLAWWLVMLGFQLFGSMTADMKVKGLGVYGPMFSIAPALLVTFTASLFQLFGSQRPDQPWSGGEPVWQRNLKDRQGAPAPLQKVNLEQSIRTLEIDRTGNTLLGSLACLLAAMVLLVFGLIAVLVLGQLVSADAVPAATGSEFAKIGAFALGGPALFLLTLSLLRQRFARWFRWLLVAFVVGGLFFVVIEPFRILAIEAPDPEARVLKTRLVVLALFTLPAITATLFAWLHALLRAQKLTAGATGSKRVPLGLIVADLSGLPRLVLALGWRNAGAQIAAVLGLILQAPMRLIGIGALSTGLLAALVSPYAYAKFQIQTASASCRGESAEPFAAIARIDVCPGNRVFDQALFMMDQGPPLLSVIALMMVVLPALAGLWLGRAALSASARRYQRVASADPRPPILYLRPFHLDRVSLKWRPRLLSTVIVPRPAEPRSIDEIILNGCIEDGPVVAYGRPGEPAPPLGAARLYVGTGDWKAMVYALADASRYIVIAVEPTDGVVWEVEQTIANGWADKTLYLLTSARTAEEAWRMVRAITGHGPDGAPAAGKLRPVAIMQRGGVWQVLFARDISRLAVEAAVQHFRMAA